MSIISPFHDVLPYNVSSKALDGQRLSIITFKTPKDKKDDANYKKPENRCVSIPILSVKVTVSGDHPDCMQSPMQALFEELQDSVIRSHVVAAIEDDAKIITVSDDQISFAACAAWAAENAISGKLTKDVINGWFEANMSEPLEVALANAMGLPSEGISAAQVEKLNAAVKQHKLLFADCAATRPAIAPPVAKSLLSALKLTEDDRVVLSLRDKLKKIAEPKAVEFFGL